jgi:DNA-nicking Smr family endonuclease
MNDKKEPRFAEIFGTVKRLKNDRVNLYSQREKKPVPVTRQESGEDQAIPFQAQVSTSVEISYFSTGLQKKLQRKIRQGLIRPETSLDLHGYKQQQAIDTLESFLDSAIRSGYRMVIIIHGQGFRSQTGAVLKPLVHRWLANQPAVLAWCPAQPRDGAAGASYVYLRVL